MLVCIDKITCARMLQRIGPRWEARRVQVEAAAVAAEADLAMAIEPDQRERLGREAASWRARAAWMKSTIIEIVISEAQNEVRDFRKADFDIVPHRERMKRGFETPDGKRVSVEDAFKDPEHAFRVAIVCAMWLTGFDVPSLATLYLDKPLKAHTLMQAIARANRVSEGKNNGLIVDYCGILKSLRQALATFGGSTGGEDDGETDPVRPEEELLQDLSAAIGLVKDYLVEKGGDLNAVVTSSGF